MKKTAFLLAGCLLLTACQAAPKEGSAAPSTEASIPSQTQTAPTESTSEPDAQPPKPEGKIVQIYLEEISVPRGEQTVYGKVYRPRTEGAHPAIILCHGYNGTNSDFTQECTLYAQNGYVACAIDFCGGSTRSKSTGKSTDMTITSEKEDLLAVLAYMRSLPYVDPSRVVLFGGSQGGLVAALAAAEQPEDVHALAMYFPALCVPDDWKKRYASPADAPETFDFWGLELGRRFVEDVHELDVFHTIDAFEGPVLILHGNQDAIVPFTYSEDAADLYAQAELILYPREGHGFSPEGAKDAREAVLSFLDRTCG